MVDGVLLGQKTAPGMTGLQDIARYDAGFRETLNSISPNDPRLEEKLREFSGTIWGILLNEMFDTVDIENSFMGAGHSEKMFRQMQMESVGLAIAKSGRDVMTEGLIKQYAKRQVVDLSEVQKNEGV